MTKQAELLKKIDKLPPRYFSEVIDFVGYLQHKSQNEAHSLNKADTQLGKGVSEWSNPLLGLAKTKGATLTLNRFMEMQQEEIALEIENDQGLWGKK